MSWIWTRENPARWDEDKQRVFGPAELASVGMTAPERGATLPDEWWRVTDDGGTVVGYGWLDNEWRDAQITFLVDPAHRGAGVGDYIVGRLEEEAGKQGLNYIYNVVPDSHPDAAWMTKWLTDRGFTPGTGDLRRRVPAAKPTTR
jgi:GNAT superfamily N-acetyltransferase